MACKYLDFQDRKKIAKMYQEEANRRTTTTAESGQ